MRTPKHLVGCVGLAITLDFLLFNGFCTQASCEALSHASNQALSNFEQFKDFSLSQFIHQIL
jgi:prophage maintenance system killer protein